MSFILVPDAHQSCSSVESTPQDEDRGFDLSDSDLSDDGNLSGGENTRTRGIVNPNYPGFQHLAHTLDYTIKALSDTDYTDDDLDLDSVNSKDFNNINNNNNNNNDEHLEYKIDSVNRLDSVENIQKVFYDKPKLNIPLEPLERDSEKKSNLDEAGGSSYTGSDEDLEGNILNDTSDSESHQESLAELKINQAEVNIIGDFGQEIEQELVRLVERGVEKDLEEAVEKLTVASDLSPSALKYNIEPNTEQPFEKSVKIHTVELLEPVTIQQKIELFLDSTKETHEPPIKHEEIPKPLNYIDVKLENQEVLIEPTGKREVHPKNITLDVPQFPETVDLKSDSETDEGPNQEVPEDAPQIKMKTTDALLSNAQDVIKNLEKDFLQQMDCDDSNRKIIDHKWFSKEEMNRDDEKDEDSTVPRKKEKMELNYVKKRKNPNQIALVSVPRRELSVKNKENVLNRRSLPLQREKKRPSPEVLGEIASILT